MSNISEKNKKEWNSPSVNRLGKAAQIIKELSKEFGPGDGVLYINDVPNPITTRP